MTNKEGDNLIELANAAADGQNIIATSINRDKDLINALNIIGKVKKSFFDSDKIFKQAEQIKEGDKWGPLVIIKKIGSGGMGLVYEAYDSVLDRNVAVKFLNPTSSQYISSQHFIAEARRIAKVRHPHVMAIFGANTYKNITGFWSELLVGKDLSQYNSIDINWNKMLDFAHDLTKAVDSIHENEIIHGDIKPHNVIIDKGKRTVLMDFGSGSDLKSANTNISSSTPIIMAPELFKGLPKSKASDIYSLGVVFYFLSSNGKYPYKATSFEDLKKQIIMHKPIDYKILNGTKSWRNLIKQMLYFDSKDSPTIKEVRRQIRKIKLAPKKRAKRIIIFSILTMLIATISVLFFSNKSLNIASHRTQQALDETREVNDLMYDLLSSTNPGMKGKDMLMVDALEQMIIDTKNSTKISTSLKAKTLHDLSLSINSLGQKQKATELLEYIYNIPDVDSYYKAYSLITRASITFLPSRDKKSIKKSLDYLTQAVKTYPKIKQTMNDVVASYNLIKSNIELELNNIDGALDLINKNIEFWKNSKQTMYSKVKMVGLYNRLGDIHENKSAYSQAIDYYKEGIEYYKNNNLTTIEPLIILNNNLAVVYRKVGRYEKAVTILFENRTNAEKFLGQESNSYISISSNLASAYQSLGNINKAIDMYKQTAKIITKKYGKQSIQYLTVNNNLTIILQNAKRYLEAENQYRENILIAKEVLGKTHRFTFLSQGNLSELLYLSGQPQKSIDLVNEILPSAITELGKNNVNVQLMKESLAWSYHLLGKNDFALPIITEVVQTLTETFGQNHELTQHASTYLTDILKEMTNKPKS